MIEKQSKLISGTAICSIQVRMGASDITDPSVSQFIQIVGGIPAGLEIVVVDTDRLIGKLSGFTNDDIHQSVFTQVVYNDVVGEGLQNDKIVNAVALMEISDRFQDLCEILTGNDHGCHMALIADLADAADGFEIEGIFIGFTVRRGQDDADIPNGRNGKILLDGGQLITQFLDDFLNPLSGFFADGGIVVAHAGHSRGGNTCPFGDIFYCD